MVMNFGNVKSSLYYMDIVAEIIKRVYEGASSTTGTKDLKASITYPTSFSCYSIQQLINSIELGGFEVISMYPEPIAAAYSIIHSLMQNPYRTMQEFGSEFNIIVYDFGGYTFDCAAIHMHDKQYELIDHKCEAYTGCFYLSQDIVTEANPNLSEKELLRQTRECMKMINNTKSMIYLNGVKIPTEISKKHILEYVKRTEVLIDALLNKLDRSLKTVLFFVGGMCSCPIVREEIREHYPNLLITEQNTFLYDVSYGAYLLGESIINTHDVKFDMEKCSSPQDPLPYSVVVTIGGEEKLLRRTSKNERSPVIEFCLDIQSTEANRVRVKCFYDHPKRKNNTFIINESFIVVDDVRIVFQCWIDKVNIVHIVSECSMMTYKKSYQGFVIQHIPDGMKEEHEKRVKDCVDAFVMSKKEQKNRTA